VPVLVSNANPAPTATGIQAERVKYRVNPEGLKETKVKKNKKTKTKKNKATSNGTKARSPRERRVGEKKRRVVGEEQGSNGISVLVSNGNELAIQLHVEPTS
jgi:hypothetical protein